MSVNYELIDNFLSPNDFEIVQTTLNSPDFPWYLMKSVASMDENDRLCEKKYNYQFVHAFYGNHTVNSNFYSLVIAPIITKLDPLAIIRIKANLNPCTDTIIKHGFHTDYDEPNITTAVFYVNTNNGKTYFDDGSYVSSIENRLIRFDSRISHTGTSCTDEQTRCVININYIPKTLCTSSY